MRLLATIVTLLGYVTAPTNLQVSCGMIHAEGVMRTASPNAASELQDLNPAGQPERCGLALRDGGAAFDSRKAKLTALTKAEVSRYQSRPAGINFAPKPGKKPQSVDQQPHSPICYCIWKVPDERLFVRKEIRCGDVPDYFTCAFLDGVYVVKR